MYRFRFLTYKCIFNGLISVCFGADQVGTPCRLPKLNFTKVKFIIFFDHLLVSSPFFETLHPRPLFQAHEQKIAKLKLGSSTVMFSPSARSQVEEVTFSDRNISLCINEEVCDRSKSICVEYFGKCNFQVDKLFACFNYYYRFSHGKLFFFKLALRDRNMQVRFFWKVVLKF